MEAWEGAIRPLREISEARQAINRIPSVEFRLDLKRGDTTCSVCLVDFIVGEIVKRMEECQHMFHGHCIETWLGEKCTCPMCRTKVCSEQ